MLCSIIDKFVGIYVYVM